MIDFFFLYRSVTNNDLEEQEQQDYSISVMLDQEELTQGGSIDLNNAPQPDLDLDDKSDDEDIFIQ